MEIHAPSNAEASGTVKRSQNGKRRQATKVESSKAQQKAPEAHEGEDYSSDCEKCQEMKKGKEPPEPKPTESSDGFSLLKSLYRSTASFITSMDRNLKLNTEPYDQLWATIGSYTDQIEYLKRQNQELIEDLQELSRVREEQEKEKRAIQMKSFKQIAHDAWTPLDDSTIKETIESIYKDIEDWVEENCVDMFEDFQSLSEEEQAILWSIVGKITYDSPSFEELVSSWSENGKNVDPCLLATAIIIHHMYDSIVNNPFLILGFLAEDKSDLEANTLTSVIHSTYNQLCSRKLFPFLCCSFLTWLSKRVSWSSLAC
jgi:hypothetical protein